MNNPFLSDRNIFSKVVNPLKKKSQTEKVEVKPSQLPQKPSFKEPYISTTPLARQTQPEKRSQYDIQSRNKVQPQQKMSFGKPQDEQNRISFNANTYTSKEKQGGILVAPQQGNRGFDYGNDSFKTSENPSNNYQKNNYKQISLERFQFTSPAQDTKFQQYRKVNNFKDYSPIDVPEKKLNDSEFLNIDAIGADLDKFLAGSKNQEQLCQLLGITRNPQPNKSVEEKKIERAPIQQKRTQKEPVQTKRIQKESFQKRGGKQPDRFQRGERQNRGKSQEEMRLERQQVLERQYVPEGMRFEKRQSEPYPSAFIKQKQKQQSEVYNPVHEPNHQEKQYIPTFNYVDLQHQNETISREEEVPRFNEIRQSQKRELKESSKDNLQVFDYSGINSHQGNKTIQDIITEQMNSLSINGKYRTFLSPNEKIVTVKYNLKPL